MSRGSRGMWCNPTILGVAFVWFLSYSADESTAESLTTDPFREGENIPGTSLTVHYPEIVSEDLQEAEGVKLAKKVTVQGLPKSHSCVCLNLNNPESPPIVPISLLQELSRTRAGQGMWSPPAVDSEGRIGEEEMVEETVGNKKVTVKMVCYCGRPSQKDQTIKQALAPVPGEDYDYLRPFSHRPFDRQYANRDYEGPRYEELWHDHDRFHTVFEDEDAASERNYMKDFSADLSEARAHSGAVDSFDAPSFNEKRSDVQNPLKRVHSGSGRRKHPQSTVMPDKDGNVDTKRMQSAVEDATQTCNGLKQKHQDLYNLMKGFFGPNMTPRSCDFWKKWIGQLHTTLKIQLNSTQMSNLKHLMKCVC